MAFGRSILTAIALGLIPAGAGWAETTIIRPGPCAAQTAYLLAENSGALVLVEPDAPQTVSDGVIFFRRKPTRGWASQRLLRRFDLQLGNGGPLIVNSGAFCGGGS